jgi:hypothetical protein
MGRTLDPCQSRQQSLGVVKRLLLRESQAQALILLFDDLHWIDTETQAMLESLWKVCRRAGCFSWSTIVRNTSIVGLTRRMTQLRLDPLPPESAGEILNSVLGNDGEEAIVPDAIALLLSLTQANILAFVDGLTRAVLVASSGFRDAVD